MVSGQGETLFGTAAFANEDAEQEVAVEALDQGRWWTGTLQDSKQKDGQLFHLVKCTGFRNVEVGFENRLVLKIGFMGCMQSECGCVSGL